MLTSTCGSRPKLSTPARSWPLRWVRMRRTAVASLSSELCTLADRSAATSNAWFGGRVSTWRPARARVSKATISTRSASETRERPADSGGGNTRQMRTISARAKTPAPTSRGRVSSKPTVEGQPFGGDDAQGGQRDPGPDLQLARMRRLHGGRPGWRKGQTVRRLELRDRVREQIDGEPGWLDFAADRLLDRIEAGWVGVRERADRARGERAPAAIRTDDAHGGRAGIRNDGHRFIRMKTAARHAGRQHPLAEVLDEDGKRDPQRQIRLVDVEAEERLADGFIAHHHQRRLQARDQRPAKGRLAQVLAAGDMDVLQVDVRQQRIGRIGGANAADP